MSPRGAPAPRGCRREAEVLPWCQPTLHRWHCLWPPRQHAVKASERAYESIDLDVEAAAIGFFLAAVESRLEG